MATVAFSHLFQRVCAALIALRILLTITTEAIYDNRTLELNLDKPENSSSIVVEVIREQVHHEGDDKHQANKLTTDSVDWERQRTRQAQASTILERLLQQEKVFENGKLSEQEYVLKHGFPLLWEPCAVERLFQQKQKLPFP